MNEPIYKRALQYIIHSQLLLFSLNLEFLEHIVAELIMKIKFFIYLNLLLFIKLLERKKLYG